MKQIKTIKNRLDNAEMFDRDVNDALAEGWQLTRRDVLQPRTGDRYTLLYAELEREEYQEGAVAPVGTWELTRDPARPHRCSNCGHKVAETTSTCPGCGIYMEWEE